MIRSKFEKLAAAMQLPLDVCPRGNYTDALTSIAWVFWVSANAKESVSKRTLTAKLLENDLDSFRCEKEDSNFSIVDNGLTHYFFFPPDLPMRLVKTAFKWRFNCVSIRGKNGRYFTNYI